MRTAVGTVGVAMIGWLMTVTQVWAHVSDRELKADQGKFEHTFPRTPVASVEESPIPGVVEIFTGMKILYYAPKQDLVLFGELYSGNGVSLTQEKLDARAQERVAHIDKTVALTVGEGTTELIAFVDPDCPHCRHAYNWLAEQKIPGLKKVIYFLPIRGRPAAEARAIQALCAPPELREEALREVFNPDPNQSVAPLQCPQGAQRLEAQGRIAMDVGVTGTPYFVLKGQSITGFDRERLAALLTDKKE
jgi:thiol:disulfide interchange protein DsbC